MTDQASPDQQEQASEPSVPSSSAAVPLQPPAAASAPIREDQVQNAVAFLSHPKVRSSSETSKRGFLERKGLTAEEIEEAFRRVPETTTPTAAVASLPSSSPAPQAALQTTLQHLQPSQQYAGQVQQHGGAMVPHPGMQMVPAAPQEQPLRWSQVTLGAGFFAAGAYAVKQLLWPYVWDAYEGWRERQGGAPRIRAPPRPKQPNGEELSAEVSRAVAEAIQAQTAELRTSIEAIRELAQSLEAQRRQAQEEAQARAEAAAAAAPAAPLGESVTVAELRQELKALASTLQECVGTMAASPAKSTAGGGGEPEGSTTEQELSEIKGLLAAFLRSPETTRASGAAPAHDFGSPLSVKSDAATGPAPHASSEQPAATLVSAFAQPSAHIKEAGSPVVGTAASPAKDGGNSARADGQSLPRPDSATSLASNAPSQPPHPPSYMEVLEMLEKGITPPGIRSDINDKAPNPEQPPPQPRLKPRPKPWEKKGAAAASSGALFFANGSAESPASSGAPSVAGSQRGAERLVDSFGGGPRGIVRSASGGSLGSSSRDGQPAAQQPALQPSFDGAARAALGTHAAPAVKQSAEEPAAVEAASAAASGEAATVAQESRVIGGQAAAESSVAPPEQLAQAAAEQASAPGAAGPYSTNTAGAGDASGPGTSDLPAGSSYKDALLGGNGGAPAEQQAQHQPLPASKPTNPAGAAGAASTPPGSHHGVFRTPPARAASIYEAVAAGPSSPGLIAGRFSPIRSSGPLPEPSMNGVASHEGEPAAGPQAAAAAPVPEFPVGSLPPPPPQLAAQQALPNAALPPTYPAYSLGGSLHQHFSSPAASSAPWRAGREAPQPAGPSSAAGPPATAAAPADALAPGAAAPGTQGAEMQDRGSSYGSIARPLASGWRPPPIPVPTLLGASGRAESRGSAHSLGEDFSSAV